MVEYIWKIITLKRHTLIIIMLWTIYKVKNRNMKRSAMAPLVSTQALQSVYYFLYIFISFCSLNHSQSLGFQSINMPYFVESFKMHPQVIISLCSCTLPNTLKSLTLICAFIWGV